ncbi:MAG: aminoacyl-tRNA deacylase [Methanococcaceae archaeon]
MNTLKVKEYLEKAEVPYKDITHPLAFSAQEIASKVHIKGKVFAKTVVLFIDGEMVMLVLPAEYKVDFEKLKVILGAKEIRLANESEFKHKFPDCEAGAMPPFGNLYNLQVFVSEKLVENPVIAFNAGSHTDVISLDMKEFQRIVQPRILDCTKKYKI